MDIDGDLEQRILIWEKLLALKSILEQDFLPKAIFEEYYILENQKEISRIHVDLNDVSIHNKTTWLQTMEFLNEKMIKVEEFFLDYKDILQP